MAFKILGIKNNFKISWTIKSNWFYSIPSVKLWAAVSYSWIVAILQQICTVGNISTKESSTNGLYANQQKTIWSVIRSSKSSFAFWNFNNLSYVYIRGKYLWKIPENSYCKVQDHYNYVLLHNIFSFLAWKLTIIITN